MMTSYARGDGLPTVAGQQPAGMLADDILSEGEGRVAALIVEASNPLLACSNPDGRLDRALGQLELLVLGGELLLVGGDDLLQQVVLLVLGLDVALCDAQHRR